MISTEAASLVLGPNSLDFPLFCLLHIDLIVQKILGYRVKSLCVLHIAFSSQPDSLTYTCDRLWVGPAIQSDFVF